MVNLSEVVPLARGTVGLFLFSVASRSAPEKTWWCPLWENMEKHKKLIVFIKDFN